MTVPCPGPGWEENPGHQPPRSIGKRVAVVLENGREQSGTVTTTAPPGWAADKANWTRSRKPWPFEIAWFRVL